MQNNNSYSNQIKPTKRKKRKGKETFLASTRKGKVEPILYFT